MDFLNALPTSMALHTAVLVIKELISLQNNYGNRPILMEFTGLNMFPTILRQLA